MEVTDSWFHETEAKIKALTAELEAKGKEIDGLKKEVAHQTDMGCQAHISCERLKKDGIQRMKKLCADILQLKTEISRVRSQNKAFHAKITDATHEYKELYKKHKKLKEALKKYGGHDPECLRYASAVKDGVWCRCGFEQALKEAKNV